MGDRYLAILPVDADDLPVELEAPGFLVTTPASCRCHTEDYHSDTYNPVQVTLSEKDVACLSSEISNLGNVL